MHASKHVSVRVCVCVYKTMMASLYTIIQHAKKQQTKLQIISINLKKQKSTFDNMQKDRHNDGMSLILYVS